MTTSTVEGLCRREVRQLDRACRREAARQRALRTSPEFRAAVVLNAAELAAERPDMGPALAALYSPPPDGVSLHTSGAERVATLRAIAGRVARPVRSPASGTVHRGAPRRRRCARRQARTGVTRSGDDPPPPHHPVKRSAPGGYPGATAETSQLEAPDRGQHTPHLIAPARTL